MKPMKDSIPTSPRSCILHVCTSCRESGQPRYPKEKRSGFILYQQLCEAIKNSPLSDRVTVQAATCLSLCPRPCGIALSSLDAWSYLFGDQTPETTHEIIECLSTYLDRSDGFMAREDRPKSLRSSILGRVPSVPRSNTCT